MTARLAHFVVQLACAALMWALLHFVIFPVGLDRELANDAVQQQRHMERLERAVPGAVARISAERTRP
jgi:hypothetical protein